MWDALIINIQQTVRRTSKQIKEGKGSWVISSVKNITPKHQRKCLKIYLFSYYSRSRHQLYRNVLLVISLSPLQIVYIDTNSQLSPKFLDMSNLSQYSFPSSRSLPTTVTTSTKRLSLYIQLNFAFPNSRARVTVAQRASDCKFNFRYGQRYRSEHIH